VLGGSIFPLTQQNHSKKTTEASFHKNRPLQDAIIRRLEIIGEAVKNLPPSFRDKHSSIPWKQMAGMRDILIHEYFDVDLSLTWRVAKQELPQIKKYLLLILSGEFTASS
jgi:uncharacterized protein with HEPN domain